MLNLFGKKKRISIVPAMVDLPDAPELPTFPTPEPLPEFSRTEPKAGPVFLKAEMLDALLNDIQAVRARLDKSERMVARIEEVHDAQGRLLQSWNGTMKEVHDKLLFLDTVLFKKGDRE